MIVTPGPVGSFLGAIEMSTAFPVLIDTIGTGMVANKLMQRYIKEQTEHKQIVEWIKLTYSSAENGTYRDTILRGGNEIWKAFAPRLRNEYDLKSAVMTLVEVLFWQVAQFLKDYQNVGTSVTTALLGSKKAKTVSPSYLLNDQVFISKVWDKYLDHLNKITDEFISSGNLETKLHFMDIMRLMKGLMTVGKSFWSELRLKSYYGLQNSITVFWILESVDRYSLTFLFHAQLNHKLRHRCRKFYSLRSAEQIHKINKKFERVLKKKLLNRIPIDSSFYGRLDQKLPPEMNQALIFCNSM